MNYDLIPPIVQATRFEYGTTEEEEYLFALTRDSAEKQCFTIRFNWAEILFYLFFLAYGYFGAQAPPYATFTSNLFIGAINLGGLSLLLVILGIYAWKWGDVFESSIVILRLDLIIFLVLTALLFALSFDSLGNAIQGDEVFYAMRAHAHAIEFLLKFASSLTALNSIPFKYLLQITSLFMVAALALFIYVSRKLPWAPRIALVLVTFLTCRLLVILFGGNANPHPPLGGVPLLVSGAILGISDFSFKFSYFIAFSLFVFAVYKMALRLFNDQLAFLFALSVGTVPLFLHLAGVVENSLWSAICFTLVMLELVTNSKPNLIHLACFVSIITLMRQPSFVAYIPILVLFVASVYRSKAVYQWADLRFILAPAILFIPFLANSILFGTPATATLSANTNVWLQMRDVLTSGVIWAAVANSVPIWWITFIPFAFAFSANGRNNRIAFAIFLLFAVLIYYAIRPELYGLAKYQAEYAVPFAVVGGVLLLKRFEQTRAKRFLSVALIFLVGLNAVEYLRIPKGNKPVDILVDSMWNDSKRFNAGYRILCTIVYDSKDAYAEVIKQGLSSNSYTAEAYGILPEIIYGYSLAAVQQANSIYKFQKGLNIAEEGTLASVSVANIEKDERIKVVVLGPVRQKGQIVSEFFRHGWVVQSTHTNTKYGSSVVIIKKPG